MTRLPVRLALLLSCCLTLGCSGLPGSHSGGGSHAETGTTPTPDSNASLLEGTPTPVEAPIPVSVQTVARGDLSTYFHTTTTLVAEQSVEVLSKGSGVAAKVTLNAGDTVKAGQVLAQLDTEEFAIARRQAATSLEQLEEKVTRTRTLFEEKMVSIEVLQDLEYQRDNARLSLETADLRLRNQKIIAPIGGVITHRYIQTGDNVSPAKPCFSILDPTSIRAKVYVPERSALQMRVGQEALLTSESYQKETFTGKIERLAPTVDAGTGTMEVVIAMTPLDPRLIVGMFLNVRIVTDTRTGVLLVPKKAIVYENEKAYAFVVEADKAVKRKVALGIDDAASIEVMEGLSEGEILVVVGQRGLKDGAKVDITE